MKALCTRCREVFLSQSALLEIEAPIKTCSDVHDQYHDLLRLFEYGGFSPESILLGDYVDRGKQSLVTMTLQLAYKAKYPENFLLLLGNHVCASIMRIYDFYDECKRRYNIKTWKQFCDVFNRFLVCGLSPEISIMDQVRRLGRPTGIPDTGIIGDLLWADPDKDITGWAENDCGVSVIPRQVVEDGYEFLAKQLLITVFRLQTITVSSTIPV